MPYRYSYILYACIYMLQRVILVFPVTNRRRKVEENPKYAEQQDYAKPNRITGNEKESYSAFRLDSISTNVM